MTVMENYHTSVQAVEPFLWTFGDGTAILLSSLLLLLLFSDLPKMTPVTPYQLIRTTKKKWLLAQFLYVVLVTVLYTVLMLLIWIPLSQAVTLCHDVGISPVVTKVLLKIKGKTNLENVKKLFI